MFEKASAEILGEPGQGWSLLQRVYDRAAALCLGQSAGRDIAEYGKGICPWKICFRSLHCQLPGHKAQIGARLRKNTLARSNCYYGAWALSTNADELPLAAQQLEVAATQAYYYASKENIQTHGGMGFTWEFDCQFPCRRSKLLAVTIGSEAVGRRSC